MISFHISMSRYDVIWCLSVFSGVFCSWSIHYDLGTLSILSKKWVAVRRKSLTSKLSIFPEYIHPHHHDHLTSRFFAGMGWICWYGAGQTKNCCRLLCLSWLYSWISFLALTTRQNELSAFHEAPALVGNMNDTAIGCINQLEGDIVRLVFCMHRSCPTVRTGGT